MGVPNNIFLFLLVVNGVLGFNTVPERAAVHYNSAFDQNLYESVLDHEKCNEQLAYLTNSSLRWTFLDATGKPPSGFLRANWNDFGDYFQCLAIDEIVNQTMNIQGKYCTITIPINQNPISFPQNITFPENVTLPDGWPEQWPFIWPPGPPSTDNSSSDAVMDNYYQNLQLYVHQITGMGDPAERFFPSVITATNRSMLGVCVPKVCTARQAVDFYQTWVPFLNLTFNEYYCRLPDDKPFVAADYVAIAIFSFIGLITLCCTAYDLFHHFIAKRPTSTAHSHLLIFSVYTNTRRFLSFSSQPGALECIDGIRAISCMWVIVGHTYCMTLLGFVHNLRDTINWLQYFSTTWINSAPIVVDTFFMISGILAVYTVIGKITRTRFVRTIHLFYMNRFLRMFPLLACMVLLQASLFNHISDGPYWLNPAHAAENCRTYWWAAILHVQNYVNPLEICLPQSWYLSVDTQLYLICPLVLVFMFGRETFAWCALTFIVLLSLVGSSLYSFLFDFSAALANPARTSQFHDYVTKYYLNTLARAPPFFIGMIYGYLLHLCRDKKIRISKINVAILWILSFVMMAFCIFSIYPVMQIDHTAQLFDNFLNAYMRAIWAIALGWLIFACVHGYGGPINWFLSLQMWKLPARMSYAMYLLHVSIIYTATGSWVKTYYFSDANNFYRFMSDLSLTLIFAFILCVCIDAPCSTIQKMLMKRGGGGKPRPQKPPQESLQNNDLNINDEKHIIKTSL